jgi:HEAT repeat protein
MTNEPHGGARDIDIERRRACRGFEILGSNAVSAAPGLLAIMITPPKREYYGFTLGVLDPYTAASYALQSIGESALPAFKAALADPNPTNRCRIVSAFNNSMRFNWTNLYAPTLAAALNDPDPEVRHAANYVLICDFGNTSIPDLAAMIKRANSSDHTRVVAAALSYIGPPAVPAVKGLLADPNQRDRDQILYAAFYAMPNYIRSPLVIESLQHQDLQVRNAATNIISENSRYWPGLTNGLRK